MGLIGLPIYPKLECGLGTKVILYGVDWVRSS